MKDVLYIGDGATISKEAIAQLAGSCALECPGIVGMAAVSKKDGLVRLVTGDSLTKGIKVTFDDRKEKKDAGSAGTKESISLTFHIIVAYGVRISEVCRNLIDNVKFQMGRYTGMQISCIYIMVEGVRPTV